MSAGKLLVVEDDRTLLKQLRWSLSGFELVPAYGRTEALELVRQHRPAVVLLDLGLPPDASGVSEGFLALEAIRELAPSTKVIIMTGQEAQEHAVRAVGSGAYDFHTKPVDPEVIRLMLDRAFYLAALEAEHQRLARGSEAAPLPGVISGSPVMLETCRTIERLAPADVSVVIYGESGTGKEVLARALHGLGPRGGRFVAINCAAIPETLLEAELFGYERGAFTGAVKQTPGKIELAHGGTLFLDEIGDLPYGLQAKLLRFLQERVLERIGGRKEIEVDVRVVCATHRDLPTLVKAGTFREDLFYRLAEVGVRIPALRERPGDAVLLARHFAQHLASDLGKPAKGLSAGAVRAIDQHGWPGNVRELQNRIKRALVMCEGMRIRAADLDLEEPAEEALALDLKHAREQAERRTLQRALAQADGNLSQAARLLGISRPTLYDLLRQHGLRA